MPALVAARYRLGASIGRGGMGRVWRAHDQILDRDVAVKEIVPPPGLTDPEGVHRRTLREARAAARLSHPGVVQIFDVLEVDGGTWIVMEFVPCRSLQEVIAADGPLPPRRVAKIGLDLVAALTAANKVGVEHRDVKPANVLLADDGRVLLTDFGIAALDDDPSTSTSDVILGSPEYMAPERAHHGHAGLAADLWSLGATLYTAVEGVSPFRRATVAATLTAITLDDPEPPQHAGPLAPALEALLRKDPATRPNAKDATRLLRSAASGAYGRASINAVRPVESQPVKSEAAGSEAAESEAAGSEAAGSEAAGSEAAGSQDGVALAAESEAAGSQAFGSQDGVAQDGVARDGFAQATVSQAAVSQAGVSRDRVAQDGAARDGVAQSGVALLPEAEDGQSQDVPVRAGNRRLWTVVAAGGLVLLLVIAAVLWLVLRPSAHGRDAATPPTPSAAHTASAAASSAAPSSSASASISPSTSAGRPSSPASTGSALPKLPSGWHDYHDKTGFSIYVPDGWTRSQDGSMVYFRGDGRTLGVDQSDHPKADPLADWRNKAAYRVSRGDFPGYQLIRLVSVDYLEKSADWEYTFDGSGGRQHVDNRNILASPKQAYSIYWQTTDSAWTAAHDDLTLIYQSFRPAQ